MSNYYSINNSLNEQKATNYILSIKQPIISFNKPGMSMNMKSRSSLNISSDKSVSFFKGKNNKKQNIKLQYHHKQITHKSNNKRTLSPIHNRFRSKNQIENEHELVIAKNLSQYLDKRTTEKSTYKLLGYNNEEKKTHVYPRLNYSISNCLHNQDISSSITSSAKIICQYTTMNNNLTELLKQIEEKESEFNVENINKMRYKAYMIIFNELIKISSSNEKALLMRIKKGLDLVLLSYENQQKKMKEETELLNQDARTSKLLHSKCYKTFKEHEVKYIKFLKEKKNFDSDANYRKRHHFHYQKQKYIDDTYISKSLSFISPRDNDIFLHKDNGIENNNKSLNDKNNNCINNSKSNKEGETDDLESVYFSDRVKMKKMKANLSIPKLNIRVKCPYQ